MACSDDRTGVEIFVHEMHGAAGEFYAVFQAWRWDSSPGNDGSSDGWIFRMRLRKCLHKIGREQPHVAGQAYQVDLIFSQHSDHLTVVNFALESL